MRGVKRRRTAFFLIALCGLVAAFAGCRTSTKAGLPNHIRTVEVHIFQNKTMYKGIESMMARGIIDRINGDPRIRVVSRGGDGLITGEITEVLRATLRETANNEPGTVLVTIKAEFSFYDQVEKRYLIEDATISSQETGFGYGIYEPSRGGTVDQGELGATRAVAAEIVRRTVGMW